MSLYSLSNLPLHLLYCRRESTHLLLLTSNTWRMQLEIKQYVSTTRNSSALAHICPLQLWNSSINEQCCQCYYSRVSGNIIGDRMTAERPSLSALLECNADRSWCCAVCHHCSRAALSANRGKYTLWLPPPCVDYAVNK